MRFRIKDTKTTLKVIAIYQILGGIFGFGLIGWLLLRTGQINGPLLFIFCLAFFLFGFSIQAGNLLLKKDSIKIGLIFSLFIQILQIIAIGVGSYSYELFSGASAIIGIDFTDGFEFKLTSSFSSFSFNINSSEYYFLKINFLAILILSMLVDIYEELYRKKPITNKLTIDEPVLTHNKENTLQLGIDQSERSE